MPRLRRQHCTCVTEIGRSPQPVPALRYADTRGSIDLPPPSLLGPHQYDNAGIAVATMRAAGLKLSDAALARGVATAVWPARMQRLTGSLANQLPSDWELWLDGGHNPGASVVLAEHLASWADRPVYLVVGMKTGQGFRGISAPAAAARRNGLGRRRARPASGVAGRSHHRGLRRHRPAGPNRARGIGTNAPNPRRPRVDLRQPVSRGRSVESRRWPMI